MFLIISKEMSALFPIFDRLQSFKVSAGPHAAAVRRPLSMFESSHCTAAAASVAIEPRLNSLGAVLDRGAESLYRIWF